MTTRFPSAARSPPPSSCVLHIPSSCMHARVPALSSWMSHSSAVHIPPLRVDTISSIAFFPPTIAMVVHYSLFSVRSPATSPFPTLFLFHLRSAFSCSFCLIPPFGLKIPSPSIHIRTSTRTQYPSPTCLWYPTTQRRLNGQRHSFIPPNRRVARLTTVSSVFGRPHSSRARG